LTVTVCPATLIVPDLGDVSVFSAMENGTLPLPLPPVEPVSVIQGAFDTAVHAHVDVVVTFTLFVDELAATERVIGATPNVHGPGEVPVWLTVKVCPATVNVPVREVGSGLAPTVNCTVAFPELLAPAVIVSHGALLAAVQSHVDGASTVTDRAPPVASMARPVADRWNVHADGAGAGSLTVNVCPAMVRLPDLGLEVVLAAALNWTVPLPLPLPPAVMLSHDTLLVAAQPHPVGAVTVTEPAPPVALMAWLVAESPYVQGVPAWLTV
jgi:hypothetical protein